MALAAKILGEWRDAERVLKLLPPDAPERPAVVAAIESMRLLYQQVTHITVPETDDRLAAARDAIESTKLLLRRVTR